MICMLNMNIVFRLHLENQFYALEFPEIGYEITECENNNTIGPNLHNDFHDIH